MAIGGPFDSQARTARIRQQYFDRGDWLGGIGKAAEYAVSDRVPSWDPFAEDAAGDKVTGDRAAAAARGAKLSGLAEDPATQALADKLYGPRGQEIDASAAHASENSASDYARRGLSSSGMAAASQGETLQRAANFRAQARANAFQEALGTRRQGILDEGSANAPFVNYDLGAEERARSKNQDLENSLLYFGADAATGGIGGEAIPGSTGDMGIQSPQMLPDEQPAAPQMQPDEFGPYADGYQGGGSPGYDPYGVNFRRPRRPSPTPYSPY